MERRSIASIQAITLRSSSPKKAPPQNLVKKSIVENETIYYANSSTEKKYVPNFLIEKDLEVNDLKTLLTGLKLVGDYLDKTILKPNNLNYPNSRLLFINSLK